MSNKITLRDNRNAGWSWFDDVLISDSVSGELGPYVITVYAIIAKHANKNQNAWPGYDLIAKLGKMSRRQAIRCVSTLEERQMITVKRAKNPKTGHNIANRYDLTHPSCWADPSDSGNVTQVTPMHLVGDSESPELESVEQESKDSSAKKPRKAKSSKPKNPNRALVYEAVFFHVTGESYSTEANRRRKAATGRINRMVKDILTLDETITGDEVATVLSQSEEKRGDGMSKLMSPEKIAEHVDALRNKPEPTAPRMMPDLPDTGMTDDQRLALLSEYGVDNE